MKKAPLFFVIFLLSIGTVAALESNFNIKDLTGMLAKVGEFLHQALSNTKIAYGITVIFVFILLYNLYAPLLLKVRIFEGEGGVELSKPGRMVALSLSALSTLGMFYKMKSIDDIASFLATTKIFGFLVISIVLWLVIWRNTHRPWWAALWACVLAFVFWTIVVGGIGATLTILGLIGAIVGIVWWLWHYFHQEPTYHEFKQAQNVEKQEVRTQQKVEATQREEDIELNDLGHITGKAVNDVHEQAELINQERLLLQDMDYRLRKALGALR